MSGGLYNKRGKKGGGSLAAARCDSCSLGNGYSL